MKLIIEKIDGTIYAYRETETVFLRNQKKRKSPQLTLKDLDKDCSLHHHPDNCHLVVTLK